MTDQMQTDVTKVKVMTNGDVYKYAATTAGAGYIFLTIIDAILNNSDTVSIWISQFIPAQYAAYVGAAFFVVVSLARLVKMFMVGHAVVAPAKIEIPIDNQKRLEEATYLKGRSLNLFLLLLLPLFAVNANAAGILSERCVTLYDNADTSSDRNTTADVVSLAGINVTHCYVRFKATYDSGTGTTLDLSVKSGTYNGGTYDLAPRFAADQCGTSTCYGDGVQTFDCAGKDMGAYFQPVVDVSGVSPNYDVEITLCYSKN